MARDALIVGINSYETLPTLTTPAEDAEAIAQLLIQYGEFNVTRLPGVKDKTTPDLLRVGRKTVVTQRQLKEALVQLFKPTGKHFPDTALFYFSGHGIRDSLGLPQGFLATSDTDSKSERWGVPLQWLRMLLQDSPIKQQIVWLDCCYSGELLNFDEANPLDKGAARDRCFIAASREFEVAYEGLAGPHSVLTKILLKALDPTLHPEGMVTNLSLVEAINASLHNTIQRPLHMNVGGSIRLTHRMREGSVVPATAVSSICPYKGLSYFDCNDTDPLYFFGREELTTQLLAKVHQSHFVAVLGASGSGKSSVVRAGLLYQLRQGWRLSGSERWPQLIFRPGSNPLQSLAVAFVEEHLSDVERAKQIQYAEELIADGASGFQYLVRAKAGQERLILVIDQFEEVFTLCQQETERQAFFACLLEEWPALSQRLCVILTMRADFFGKCAEQPYAKLNDLIQAHLITVSPMTAEELRQVIESPARAVHFMVEPELVNTMIEEVTAFPGSLPLLEYTLWALWQAGHQENLLSSKHYMQLGGIKGALRQRADQVYAHLTEEEKEVAKVIFLELTQLGEGTEDTRKQVMKQDLITPYQSETVVDKTLQKLVADRLVVTDSPASPDQEPKRVVIDVAHEALIRHWPRLKTWIDENRTFKAWRDKLRQAEREWQEKQQDEGLLLRGAKFLEAQEQEKEHQKQLTERETAFIAASRALQEREQEEKKRIRQEREAARLKELEQAKQLAEEQTQRIKEQQQATQRLRQRLVVALGGLMLAVMAAGIAIYYWHTTQKQIHVSRARQLDAQSLLALKAPDSFNGYFDRALLLAVQAFKEQDDPETRGTLLRAMKDVDENHPAAYLYGHRSSVTSVAFSPDGQLLVSGSSDDTIILWQVATQKPVATLQGHRSVVTSLAFSPDGQILASGSEDQTIILWQVTTRKPVATLQRHSSEVSSLAFSPDGQTLASGSMDQTIILWQVGTRKPLATLQEHSKGVTSLAFSPDGQTLASGSEDHTVMLWQVGTRKPVATLQGHSNVVTSLAFSPDGQTLASGSDDQTIILWQVSTRKPLATLLEHRDQVSSLAFSPDDQTLASGSRDQTVILWQVSTRKPLATLPGYYSLVTDLAFNPDGQTLASGSVDQTVILWQVGTRKPLATLPGHRSLVTSLAFSPDGQTLASGSRDQTIILWQVGTRKPLATLQRHSSEVSSLAFSPDGQTLASGSWDRTIILWQVSTRKPLATLPGHRNVVTSLAFSPDGQTLASGSMDKTIILWQVSTRKPLATLPGHRSLVTSLAFSPDGQTLASGSGDQTVILWQVNTRKPLATLPGHRNEVTSLAFSPDGQTLASGSMDKTIILWQVNTRKPPATLPGHRNEVTSLAFSPDGQTLASGSWDQTVILWEVNPQSWQKRACRIAGRNLTRQEWQNSVGDDDYQKTCPEYPSDEALALIEEGQTLAKQAEPHDIEAATAKFNEAFSSDSLLKEHPLYNFDPEVEAKKIAASTLVNKGESLASEEKLEEAIAAFKRAKELDASLTFDSREKASKLVASALVDEGTTSYKEREYKEAATTFAQGLQYFPEHLVLLSSDAELALVQNDLLRFQERLAKLLPRIEEDKNLAVILPFFSWLAEPKQDGKAVLAAIEQHPDLTVEWDFSDLEPAIQRQAKNRQVMARAFIQFFNKEIDWSQLKAQLAGIHAKGQSANREQGKKKNQEGVGAPSQ